MFVYVFGRYFGGDKVARRSAAADFRVQAGDVVRIHGDYMLCLGETCAFSETVRYEIAAAGGDGAGPADAHVPGGEGTGDSIGDDSVGAEKGVANSNNKKITPEVHIKQVLSEQGLAMLHRFVEYRYTTYHKAVPLRLGGDEHIGTFLRGAPKKSLSKKGAKHAKEMKELGPSDKGNEGCQKLIVVPDLWTAQAAFGHMVLAGGSGAMPEKDVFFLHGQSTDKHKRDAFRALKAGEYTTLLCTPSQIFQDWTQLTSIVLVDQHKWRYKNQQDPRYDAVRVVQVRAEQTGAALVLTGSVLTPSE